MTPHSTPKSNGKVVPLRHPARGAAIAQIAKAVATAPTPQAHAEAMRQIVDRCDPPLRSRWSLRHRWERIVHSPLLQAIAVGLVTWVLGALLLLWLWAVLVGVLSLEG